MTGEVGYEFLMRTDTGKAHELWRHIRRIGEGFGLRELGFKAQLVGHTETGIATVVRDFLPARMKGEAITKFARLWASEEEVDAIDSDLTEHFCSPAELGWAHTINLNNHDFFGRAALLREGTPAGPARALVGLMWNSDDMAGALRGVVPRRAIVAAARPSLRPVPHVLSESSAGRSTTSAGRPASPTARTFAA